jgi:hypothetical protein
MTTTQPDPSAVQSSAAEPSIGTLASDASRHLSTIVRGEIKLAKAEIGASVKNAGTGVGLFIVAAILLVFSLTFGLIALAEALISLGLWRWVGYVIVFGFLVLVATVLVFVGVRKVKRVKSPQRTIRAAKETAAALKHPGRHSA